eukprot:gene14739-19812_t
MATPAVYSDVDILGIDESNVFPACGVICFVCSIYYLYPDCCGCAGKDVCLCCYREYMCLKPGREHDECCICSKGEIICANAEVFCANRSQVCCCDFRMSLPTTEEIPCLFTCCCHTFCYQNRQVGGCCKSMNELQHFVIPPPPHTNHL